MTDELTERRCSHCKQTKPIEEFGPHIGKPGGRRRDCRVCQREASRAHYQRVKARNLALRAAESA